MEIRDVVTIQALEEYLKERNFKVNAYEEDILQAIWPFLRDRQLFFLIKNPHYPNDFEWLRNRFYEKIEGKYSKHYAPGILRANAEGDFWARVPILNWKPVKKEDSEFYDWEWEYINLWRKFQDIFHLSHDYECIYQDEHLQIIVFLLRLFRPEIHNSVARGFYRDGYYQNPESSCDVIKSWCYQDYSYVCQTPLESIEMLGLNEFFRLEPYYRKQKKELEEKIRTLGMK